MAGRVATAGGVLLASLVTVGTGLYVSGLAPPFPWNAHAFNALVLISIAYALRFGRARRP